MQNTLQYGTTVYTSDGEELGAVGEVRGAYFRVDAPLGEGFWLSCDAVHQVPGGRASVAFTSDLLEVNKQPEPATA